MPLFVNVEKWPFLYRNVPSVRRDFCNSANLHTDEDEDEYDSDDYENDREYDYSDDDERELYDLFFGRGMGPYVDCFR